MSTISPSVSAAARRWWLPLLAVFCLLLRGLLPPALLESAYSRGLFPLLRSAYDATLGRLPFPLFYLFWIGVVVGVVWVIRRLIRLSGGTRWRWLGRVVINAVAGLIVWFLVGWGFNYGRLPVTEAMGFSEYDMSLDELRERVYGEAADLARLRAAVTSDTLALTVAAFPADLEAVIRPLVAAALRAEGYPDPGRPRARHLVPEGLLLRLGTAGVYWPFVAEGHIDAGLHPVQQPPVMAHELAHAYGFGDEGVCSFWAWLAAAQTDDPLLAYTLRLGYWRRIAGRLRSVEPEAYWAWREERLAPGIRNDLRAIYDNAERFQDLAPALRDATYGTYLQLQGIHDGLLNYGTVVRLVEGYRRR